MDTFDFSVSADGPWATIYLLTPNSDSAKEWVDDNIAIATYFGNAVVVEHRYIEHLLRGILEDGLSVYNGHGKMFINDDNNLALAAI